MSDPSLIESLETLSAAYNQRQKATTAVLASLKATSSSLTKASRTLKDYAERNAETDLAKIAQAQETLDPARFKESALDPLQSDLKREVKTLTTLSTALKDALAGVRVDPLDVVRLDKAYKALQTVRIQDATLQTLMPQLADALTAGVKSLATTFGVALRDALATQGIELGGRPPVFEIGRFELKADYSARRAVISYGKEVVNKGAPLSVEGLIKAYIAARKTVTERAEEGKIWIQQLYEAWETARRRKGITDVRANLVECYYELVLLRQGKSFRSTPSKGGFRDYTRAQFAFDLDRFLNRERLTYNGQQAAIHVAVKSNTDSADRSLWVVDGSTPYDGSYMGDLEFRKPA